MFMRGSQVVHRAAWRGMLNNSVRLTCEDLATAEKGHLTVVLCVKGDDARRINEILYVEEQLTSNLVCKARG
jgi:hypothetical protein